MQKHEFTAALIGQIPTIPVGTGKPIHYKKWQEMYRIRLRLKYETFEADNPGELSFEQFCQRVFMWARSTTEPMLN
jgi:hypothetical protein